MWRQGLCTSPLESGQAFERGAGLSITQVLVRLWQYSHVIRSAGTKAPSVLTAVPDIAVSQVVISVENSLTKT